MANTPDWMRPEPDAAADSAVDLHTDRPHSARIYDFILGGKDNFPADRDAAGVLLAEWPALRTSMRENRSFMRRATRYLVEEAGVRQFLDVGTGIPTSPNLHEVAQDIAPESRVLYVDNDPIVLAHARALLSSSPEGVTAYLDADMREPAKILQSQEFKETFDLAQPVAVSLIAVLHFIPDEAAYDLVAQLLEPLSSGSFLALTVVTKDTIAESVQLGAKYKANGIYAVARTRTQVARFFDGLELVEPGMPLVQHWRPTGLPVVDDTKTSLYAGVARKP